MILYHSKHNKYRSSQGKKPWRKPDSSLRQAQTEWLKMEWQLAKEEREKNEILHDNKRGQKKSS